MAKTKTKPKLKAVAPKAKARTPAKGTPTQAGTKTPGKGTPIAVKPEKSARLVKPGPQLRSLRSLIYTVGDLDKAKAFYAAVLARAPYFDQPYYVGFDVDGQELGLDPDTSNRKPGPGGAVGYWKVDDIHTSWEFSISNGGEPIEPPHAVGEDTSVALIADPFGNYVGLIQAP